MSNFWDSILASTTGVEEKKETSDFWSTIGIGFVPEKKSKPTAKKSTAKKSSKTVEQAEQVYETVDELIVPAENCTHHWVIGSGTKWTIGTCKQCNGEKWFNNDYAEQTKFNDSLVSPMARAEGIESKDTLKSDLDIQDLKTAYKVQQSSDFDGESE